MLDEHIPPDFALVLRAYGHTSKTVVEVGLREAADVDLMRNLAALGLDALLSLDQNREEAVWAEMLHELSTGTGRLVRIKLGRRDRLGIPTLTRTWARGYEELEPMLTHPRVRLVQLGRELVSQRQIPAPGFKVYNAGDVGQLSQQIFNEAPDGSLRVKGSPRITIVHRAPGVPAWARR